MIPEHAQAQVSSELAALGGTPDQIEQIGDILYRLSFAPRGHDTEYLLDTMRDTKDPLVKRACKIMMDGMLSE